IVFNATPTIKLIHSLSNLTFLIMTNKEIYMFCKDHQDSRM
ncbi:16047_t:CDS:1, partial [Funneliformis mosseae]